MPIIVKFSKADLRREKLAKKLREIAQHDVDGTGKRRKLRISARDYKIIVAEEDYFAREAEAQHDVSL